MNENNKLYIAKVLSLVCECVIVNGYAFSVSVVVSRVNVYRASIGERLTE